MAKPRTVRCFGFILLAYGVLVAPSLFWPWYLDSPFGLFVILPVLSVYVLHSIGVPFLLESEGMCGWGWCSPTLFGGIFAAVIWLAIAWLLASAISALIGRFSASRFGK